MGLCRKAEPHVQRQQGLDRRWGGGAAAGAVPAAAVGHGGSAAASSRPPEACLRQVGYVGSGCGVWGGETVSDGRVWGQVHRGRRQKGWGADAAIAGRCASFILLSSRDCAGCGHLALHTRAHPRPPTESTAAARPHYSQHTERVSWAAAGCAASSRAIVAAASAAAPGSHARIERYTTPAPGRLQSCLAQSSVRSHSPGREAAETAGWSQLLERW